LAIRKTKQLVELPSFLEYSAVLDLDKVAEEIARTEPGELALPQYDFADAKRAVWLAGETWVPVDILEFKIEGLESRFSSPISGVKDMTGIIKGNGFAKELEPFTGRKFVLDWKTTRTALDAEWERRQIDSWQWKIYAAQEEADVFIYRGISRNGKTREIVLKVPDTNRDNVRDYIRGVGNIRDSLVSLAVYPRHMPYACNAYGRECPFYGDCSEGRMPLKIIEPKTLSYTSMETLLLCPEKYRRSVMTPGANDNDDNLFGKAVHRGLAELYRQVKEKLT
jgi:hypothetical protein